MTTEYKEIIELQPIKEIRLYDGAHLHAIFKEENFKLPTTLRIENGYAKVLIAAVGVYAGDVGRAWNASYLILQNIDVLWHMTFKAKVLFENYKCIFDEVMLLGWCKTEQARKGFYTYELEFTCSQHKIIGIDEEV